ncbi:MAG: hypothetical protein R2852_04610 [Bacteroidia bacterium]
MNTNGLKATPILRVFSRNKDVTGLDTGTYYAWVKDTLAKCEVVDKTVVEAPEELKVRVYGGGSVRYRVCDTRPIM